LRHQITSICTGVWLSN